MRPKNNAKIYMLYDKILTTALGAGYSPFGPGTMGALVGTLCWVLGYFVIDFGTLQIITGVCVIFFTLISIRPINRLETIWGKDPSRVVIDEVVGVWICLLAVPDEPNNTRLWIYVMLAFALFRLFDILKPLGIRRMENLPGSWGVMMDDVLAGCWGFLVMVGCRQFF